MTSTGTTIKHVVTLYLMNIGAMKRVKDLGFLYPGRGFINFCQEFVKHLRGLLRPYKVCICILY